MYRWAWTASMTSECRNILSNWLLMFKTSKMFLTRRKRRKLKFFLKRVKIKLLVERLRTALKLKIDRRLILTWMQSLQHQVTICWIKRSLKLAKVYSMKLAQAKKRPLMANIVIIKQLLARRFLHCAKRCQNTNHVSASINLMCLKKRITKKLQIAKTWHHHSIATAIWCDRNHRY